MRGRRPGRWVAAIGALAVVAGVAALVLSARMERAPVDPPSVAAPAPAPSPEVAQAVPPEPPPQTQVTLARQAPPADDDAKAPGQAGHGAAKKEEKRKKETPAGKGKKDQQPEERTVPAGLAEQELDLYLAKNPPAAGSEATLERWLEGLRTASYAFNTPSPVRIDESFQVQAAIAPGLTRAELRAQLSAKLARPGDKVSSGGVLAAPRMKAVLDGGGAFDISEARGAGEIREISESLQAVWTWNVAPRQPGKSQPLVLSFYVVPPASVSPDPIAIKVLNRRIDVDVTYPWLFDHYWEKYWKWLIGGVATAVSACFAWWWKRHFSTPAGP